MVKYINHFLAPIIITKLFHFILIFICDVGKRSLVTKVQKNVEYFLRHVFYTVIFLLRIQIK